MCLSTAGHAVFLGVELLVVSLVPLPIPSVCEVSCGSLNFENTHVEKLLWIRACLSLRLLLKQLQQVSNCAGAEQPPLAASDVIGRHFEPPRFLKWVHFIVCVLSFLAACWFRWKQWVSSALLHSLPYTILGKNLGRLSCKRELETPTCSLFLHSQP